MRAPGDSVGFVPGFGGRTFRVTETTMDGKRCRILGFPEPRPSVEERQERERERVQRARAFAQGEAFKSPEGRRSLLERAGLRSSPPPPGEQPDVDIDIPVPDEDIPGNKPHPPRVSTTVRCYWYTWWEEGPNAITAKPGPVGGLPTLSPFDACDPEWVDPATEFTVCMEDGFTFAEAVTRLGPSWEEKAWHSINQMFEGQRLSDDAFAALLPPRGEGLGEWEAYWDPSPTGMNYTPANATPRLTVLRAALDLIVGFSAGIPIEVKGHEVRKHVLGPIRQGWMEYHLSGGWNDHDHRGCAAGLGVTHAIHRAGDRGHSPVRRG